MHKKAVRVLSVSSPLMVLSALAGTYIDIGGGLLVLVTAVGILSGILSVVMIVVFLLHYFEVSI